MISVIIPTYNCTKYLTEAIDSVLNQTYQNFEIIIVDDGSTDNTNEIVANYIKHYPQKIRYFYQNNRGVGSARNKGIKESKGEYLAFLDDDDYFLPNFLEECLTYLIKNNKDFVIPKTYLRRFENNSGSDKLVIYNREIFPENNKDLYVTLFKNFVGCVKMVSKKYCFEKIGLFDENFLFHDDWDIWVRFIKSDLKTGLVPNTEPLWVYRIRSDSLFQSTYKQKNGLMDKYYAFKKHKAEAFKFNPYLKKVYGEKLFFIGKEVFVIPGCKFLGIKILLESQICDFNAKKITEQVKKLLKKLSYGKS